MQENPTTCPRCGKKSVLFLNADNWCCERLECGARTNGFERHIASVQHGTGEYTKELLWARWQHAGHEDFFYFEKALGRIAAVDEQRRILAAEQLSGSGAVELAPVLPAPPPAKDKTANSLNTWNDATIHRLFPRSDIRRAFAHAVLATHKAQKNQRNELCIWIDQTLRVDLPKEWMTTENQRSFEAAYTDEDKKLLIDKVIDKVLSDLEKEKLITIN